MKKKNGFTLVELTMSLALLSLALVFVIKFVTEIRKDEDSVTLNTELSLINNIISKKINKDIISSGGIKELDCDLLKCTITFLNEEVKELEIINNETTLSYNNVTTSKKEFVKKLPNDYKFNITNKETEELFIIEINIGDLRDYDISIVNKKI